MRWISFYCILISFSFCGCIGTSYWTTSPLAQMNSAPYATELQITDSTIADYAYNWRGCLTGGAGLCSIRKSEFIGDTLLVYDLKYQANEDSSFYSLKRTITEAYLRKGRKLYPIYNYYPTIYGIWDSENLSESTPDTSGIKQFNVNWEGWSNEPTYINYKGTYQKKGKYKPLRQQLNQEMKAGDSVVWYIYHPREFVDDTNYYQPSSMNRLGPFKN